MVGCARRPSYVAVFIRFTWNIIHANFKKIAQFVFYEVYVYIMGKIWYDMVHCTIVACCLSGDISFSYMLIPR